MKDKDPNEDEFNQEEQDNINEADDSFGLPDLDFNTLDEESEEEEASAEPEVEEESVVEDSVQETEEPEVEEEPSDEVETDSEEEIIEEELVTDADEAPENDEADAEVGEDEETTTTKTYVPPQPESNTPRIIAALVITVLLSGAIWYFAFYRPQKNAEEKARQEQIDKQRKADALAKKKAEEAKRLAAEQEANAAADADEVASKEAVFTTISAPTGRYYIVIASFIDADMAGDLGEKLKADGISSALLSPKGDRKFNRLTLGDYGSFAEAQEEANKLKGDYGDGLWVLKY